MRVKARPQRRKCHVIPIPIPLAGSARGVGFYVDWCSLTASADALGTGPLVQVSEFSPFGALANCGNFPGNIDPGTVFLDSEVEPWVDVNPVNPDNIVAFWQQGRWSNGGARGNVAGVSLDGGISWSIVPVPGLTECAAGISNAPPTRRDVAAQRACPSRGQVDAAHALYATAFVHRHLPSR